MALLTLSINEDTVIELDELKDDISGEFLDDGDLVMAIYDATGGEVVGDLAVTAAPESSGKYRGVVPGETELSPNCRYLVVITGTAGGAPVYRPLDAVARYR